MWKIKIFITLAIIISTNSILIPSVEYVYTTIENGMIRGTQEQVTTGTLLSVSDRSYFAFRGIPYAAPPIGNLRFRNPVKYTTKWRGIQDATMYGSACLSGPLLPFIDIGTEDCLYLNVFTPNLNGNLPVMVFIHGGAFSTGDGGNFFFGPNYFMNEDIVLVTLNYRLGVLGFLSTGDDASPGNFGLKDQVMALRWVQKNIANFGGNKNSVTIFGESAGAASVNFLMLSPMAKGLFHRAIMQSGSAMAPWAFQENPLQVAKDLATQLQIPFTSTKSFIAKLRTYPAATIADQLDTLLRKKIPRLSTPLDYSLVLENFPSSQEKFLTESPIDLMQRGAFAKVPVIIGYNNIESLFMQLEIRFQPNIFQIFEADPSLYVPYSFKLEEGDPGVNSVVTALKKQYFSGRTPNFLLRYQWAQYLSDRQFIYPIDWAVNCFAEASNQPIYYYKFSYDGTFNWLKKVFLLEDQPGAMHAEELFYMFQVSGLPFSDVTFPTDPAITVRSRMVKMWTNFATFGNPTPTRTNLLPTSWAKFSLKSPNVFEITNSPKVLKNPATSKLKLWYDFQNQFNP